MRQELAIRDKINTILNEGERLDEGMMIAFLAGLASLCIGVYLAVEGYNRAADKVSYRRFLEKRLWGAARKAKTMAQEFPPGRDEVEPLFDGIQDLIAVFSGRKEITSWKQSDGAPAETIERISEITDFFWEQYQKWKRNLPRHVLSRVENAARRIPDFTFGQAATT